MQHAGELGDEGLPVGRSGHRPDVTTRAEDPPLGTDDDGSDLRLAGPPYAVAQRERRGKVQRVAGIRAVEPDRGNVPLDLEQGRRCRHGCHPAPIPEPVTGRPDLDRESRVAPQAGQEQTVPVIGGDFERVVAAAQSGDETAFAQLWRDLNPALLRYLTLAGESAEEVAADTWLTVVKGLATFTGDETAWRAWVFTTARRRAVDAGRKRAREAGLGWRASTWASDQVADCADAVVELASTEDALCLVRRLPALQAEVVLLRIVAGLPVAEVADMLGRTPGAVRVACHRGLQTLSGLIGPDRSVTPRGARALRE